MKKDIIDIKLVNKIVLQRGYGKKNSKGNKFGNKGIGINTVPLD